MSRGQILKILVILLTISIMLSVAVAIVEDSSTGSKLVGTSVNVLPAKVDWARTYGAVGDDDRAYCALPVGNGYLVVGSSQSNKTLVTVGWAVNLDQNGNPVWNQTFLVGSGTEIRYAANLAYGFFLVGN
ncbi:MAG TPA: hypothetical protein VMD05_05265, partial [Candidatus Nanoarchaeia archaeon]|nr:hypothetical protein [Candidatus Nanoarchaeia archaeon]